MAIDPSKFHLVNVVDTCAVWNVLSSARLYSAAKEIGCEFCMTGFVYYECLIKKRGNQKIADKELMKRLQKEQDRGGFKAHGTTIDDLQRVAQLEQRKRLGKGELSTIAFAMKINHAVMTDDQKARRLTKDAGHPLIQTTPHLFAWLIFKQRLMDADKSLIIRQHEEMGQILTPQFEEAYRLALICGVNSRDKS